MGGRRPKHSSGMSPAEEEKRKVRRERNKLAAARCRKRRVDQTNELCDKVTQLEREKQKLQNEIQELQNLKEDLEFCLDNHRAHCQMNVTSDRKSPMEFKQPIPQMIHTIADKIKTEPIDNYYNASSEDGPPSPKRLLLSSANPIITSAEPPTPTTLQSLSGSLLTPTIGLNGITITTANKPNRPSSLNVPLTMLPSHSIGLTKNDAGIPITTPSNGVIFNFDSLMDGGTGLTPVSQPLMPNCSSLRQNPLDLVTPTSEPSKLVSL